MNNGIITLNFKGNRLVSRLSYLRAIKHLIYISISLISFLGYSQSIDSTRIKEVEKTENIGDEYFEEGRFAFAEKAYLEAKNKARELNNLELEINVTRNYISKFLNISSVAKNLEILLELKEEALSQKNDSLVFQTYKLVIQQYVVLGEKKTERKAIGTKMLSIAQKLDDGKMMASAYFSLGTSTSGQESIDYYRESLQYYTWEDDKLYYSVILNNLSSRYRTIGDIESALNCADSAYRASVDIERSEGMAASKYRSAEAYYDLEEYEKAVQYGKKALSIFKNEGILRRQDECARVISDAFRQMGDFEDALFYFKLKVDLEDSLKKLTESKEALFVGRKMEYKMEQKKDSLSFAQEREINSLELANVNGELAKERMQKYIVFGGGAFILIFAIVLWVMIRRILKDNKLIVSQKELVEEKNKEIMDSITYAKRIQSAILPPTKLVKEYLKDSFILYKPKEVVAGDFYWMETRGDKVLFAAADCTGHGVPGAMVSVVCNNALNRSVREHGLEDPGEILNKTREIVIQEFEKSDENVKDGMDIAICSLTGNKLEYAGAHNPLWIIRRGELLETKANKQPIGQFINPEPYTTHNFDLESGDTIYLFSDGFADQFGGEKGKKFMSKAFKDLLLSLQDKPMDQHKLLLDEAFESWKGALDQIDDVCVIGVRV